MASALDGWIGGDTLVTASDVDLASHPSTGTHSPGASWLKCSGLATGGMGVSHARSAIYPTSANNSMYVFQRDPLSPDYTVEADLVCDSLPPLTTLSIIGICARASSSSNTKYSLVFLTNGGSAYFQTGSDYSGGGGAIGATFAATPTIGDRYHLRLDVYGSTINGFVTDLTSGGSQVAVGGGTDTNISAKGSAGVTSYGVVGSDSTYYHLENFAVTYPVRCVFLGDSKVDGYQASDLAHTSYSVAVAKLGSDLSSLPRGIACLRVGQSSSDSSDWLRNSTTQGALNAGNVTKGAVSAGASNNVYNTAASAIAAFGRPDVISIELGTNDAKTAQATSQSAWQSNMGALISQLQSDYPGSRIVLQYCPWIVLPNSYNQWTTGAATTLLLDYQAATDALVTAGGGLIWPGTKLEFTDSEANAGVWFADGVHFNDTGQAAMGNNYYPVGIEAAISGAAPVVSGASSGGPAYLWYVLESGGGTIDANGNYVAPSTPGKYHVVAVSIADPTQVGVSTVRVN